MQLILNKEQKMLTVKQIKEKMKDRNIRAVSRECKLHENTIYTFMRSENPRTRTAEILSNYLEGV
jgi:hypothetical protein